MKKLFIFLLLVVAVTTLKAQDTTKPKRRHEYAFVCANIKTDTLFIYFDSVTTVNVCRMVFFNLANGLGPSYSGVTKGFDKYKKAFDYLEDRDYEFMGTGSYLYGEFNVPYYMFRRLKQQ